MSGSAGQGTHASLLTAHSCLTASLHQQPARAAAAQAVELLLADGGVAFKLNTDVVESPASTLNAEVLETKDRTTLQAELTRAGADGWELVSTTAMFDAWMTKVIYTLLEAMARGNAVHKAIFTLLP